MPWKPLFKISLMGTSVCLSHLHLRRQVGFEGVIAGCNDAVQLTAIRGGAAVYLLPSMPL
jgi:hypothetical protein